VSALHAECLASETREAIERLAERRWSGDFYLAGGAALALHLGHRALGSSRDLDLMSGTHRLLPADRRDLLSDLLSVESTTRVETARDGYLFVRWPGAVALRFFWYPYPLVEATADASGLAVASLLDLVLMKLGALISRGTRRDFVDLYISSRTLPLGVALTRAPEKFGHVGDFALQAFKALADFSEAEDEPMPRLSEPVEWSEVARWALAEAQRGGESVLRSGAPANR
jgi:nucleotidyltransferase AbiEii toxin of type IV toxin-antitoxin system